MAVKSPRVTPATSGNTQPLAERTTANVIDAAAGFVDRLSRLGGPVHVLATSREPLNVHGESVLRLQPLGTDDALELLVRRIEDRGRECPTGAEAGELMRRVTRAVDRLPLGIELAMRLGQELLLRHHGLPKLRVSLQRDAQDLFVLVDELVLAQDAQLHVLRRGHGPRRRILVAADDVEAGGCRFPAGMALVDCSALKRLVRKMDQLSRYMIKQSDDPTVLHAMREAMQHTPRFASFLNLEYYDLQLLISRLRDHFQQRELLQACNAVMDVLSDQVLLYERHTLHNNITGMSVYLSNPLVPDNIFSAHQTMYLQSRFSRDTHWDEMIDCFRERLK